MTHYVLHRSGGSNCRAVSLERWTQKLEPAPTTSISLSAIGDGLNCIMRKILSPGISFQLIAARCRDVTGSRDNSDAVPA